MTLLLAISGVLLAASATLIFGWPLLLAGPGRRVQAMTSPEAKFLAGAAASVAIAAILIPLTGTALISGSDTVQLLAHNVQTMEFGL